jgi:SEC-C motif
VLLVWFQSVFDNPSPHDKTVKMGDENQDSPALRSFQAENEAPAQAEVGESDEQAQSDARALVDKMLECGEWPPPELMQEIVSQGDAAIEPLLDVLRSAPQKQPGLDALCHAGRLLSVLRRPETVRELVEIIKAHEIESSTVAAEALVDFGAAGFDAFIDLCLDPSINGYLRIHVMNSAADAAGDDPARRARVGEIFRPVLDQAIALAREELKTKGFLEKIPPEPEFDENDDEDWDEVDDFEDPDDVLEGTLADWEGDSTAEFPDDGNLSEEDFDDDREGEVESEEADEIEPLTAEALGHVVRALSTIADPLARDAIMKALDDGLVDEYVVTRNEVVEDYEEEVPQEEDTSRDWLSVYRDDYAAHLESLRSSPPPAKPATTPRPKYRYQDRYDEGEPPADIPATQPIRNTGPRVGRNDPCWCGSGKKYKKCHLGKDTTI